MAAVSQKIPNLLGGVSQQPDPVKIPGQVREAENVYLDPTFGCRKRPGTKFIKELATNIPAEAKWFPIFRDENERYVVALYVSSGSTVVRVFDAFSGTERTVTSSGSSAAYLTTEDIEKIKYLTIADYTLLSNDEVRVNMGGSVEDTRSAEALVEVNQVSYNTTYAIDLAKDGDSSTQIKVYRATAVELIQNATYEDNDGGNCSDVDASDFTLSDTGKSGLQVRLTNQCSAYLKTDRTGTVTELGGRGGGGIPTSQWMTGTGLKPGQAIEVRYYDYDDEDNFQIRNVSGDWSLNDRVYLGPNGGYVRVTNTETSSNSYYVSRYTADVLLKNGGQGWRVGDEQNITMNGITFRIRVTGEEFTYTYSSDGSAAYTTVTQDSGGTLDIGAITTGLVNAVNNISNYSAEQVGNVVRVTRSDTRDFNISVRGGSTNRALTVLKNTAQDIAELPSQAWPGMVLKVVNTEDAESDDYYVKFESDAPGIPGAGNWVETVKPGLTLGLDSSTMPHALIREANGNFSLKPVGVGTAFDGWAQREVGDENSNPEPSFVGKTISNMFFSNNRLGFLSEDSCIMSQPSDFFNFFVTSALTISDADPIDISASSKKPPILKAAASAPKGLILFAESAQFLLSSEDLAFAPSTVKLTEISQYSYKSKVDPILTGVSATFISEAETYTKVLEVALDSINARPAIADITRTVPEFIPTGLTFMEGSPTNNMMIFGDGSKDVYIFKYFNEGEKRQLAGWAKWVFPTDVSLLSMVNDTGYIVQYDGSSHTLQSFELLDDPKSSPITTAWGTRFTPRLDRYITQQDLTPVDQNDGTHKITLPSGFYVEGADIIFVPTTGQARLSTITATYDNGFILVPDDLVASNFTVGLKYTSKITLPTIHVTKENISDRVNVPMVEFMDLNLYYSGRYTIEVSKQGYDTYTTIVGSPQANIYDAGNAPLNEIATETLPIFSPGDIVYVTVKAEDIYPSSITSYSWKGHYNNRGIATI
tara:strand:- start:9166 stop:12132 length:2967 start_codon:yes stop_codon:yes gene_type:complete